MFVDASAIVAILLCEPGYEGLERSLGACRHPLTSGLAVYEAVLAVARFKMNFAEAEATVSTFVTLAKMEFVPIDERVTRAALAAFARYGKGQGHPAQLNMGDCFAYACASVRDLPLLYVGNDFAQTDILSAAD